MRRRTQRAAVIVHEKIALAADKFIPLYTIMAAALFVSACLALEGDIGAK